MPRRSSEALAVPPNYGWCGRHWSQPTSDESVASIFALIGVYVLLWSAAWFACAGVSAVLIKPRLPASTRDDENSASYIGQKLVAGLKCALVAGLTNAALLEMVGQPPHVQQLPHLYTELAGVHFTAFETADMLLSAAYGHLDRLYFVHHLIHISMGLLIRGSCGPQFTASVLMAQETSGIFLNYYLLLRYRPPASAHWSVKLSQLLFALSFFAWRLGLGTYGTLDYMYHYGSGRAWSTLPGHVQGTLREALQVVLAVALVAASVMQWYWGGAILRMAKRRPASERAVKRDE